MNLNSHEYRLMVAFHRAGYSEDENAACAVLIDLVRNNLLGADNLALPTLFVLDLVPALGPRIVHEFLRGDYVLYTQTPPDMRTVGKLPALIGSPREATKFFEMITKHLKEPTLYPLALWAIPRERASNIIRAINAFSAIGRDSSIFDDTLQAGAIRLSIDPSSFTLSMECSRIEEAERVVREVSASIRDVDWEIE